MKIQTTIQYIQKTTVLIALGTLTALYKGLSAYGCGVIGITYEDY